MPRRNPKKMRGKSKLIDVIYEPVANRLTEALDPDRASSKPKVWADMSKAERDAITAAYKRGGK